MFMLLTEGIIFVIVSEKQWSLPIDLVAHFTIKSLQVFRKRPGRYGMMALEGKIVVIVRQAQRP